ncbi:MAG: hypothetical protein LBI69_03335 [Puniceicoccales bacterium]|nr:hypothetical protein [Puniceicoccales bacterium]
MDDISRACGEWVGDRFAHPLKKIPLILLTIATVAIKIPIWALAILLSPLAFIIGGRPESFLRDVISMEHLWIFFSAAFGKQNVQQNSPEDQNEMPTTQQRGIPVLPDCMNNMNNLASSLADGSNYTPNIEAKIREKKLYFGVVLMNTYATYCLRAKNIINNITAANPAMCDYMMRLRGDVERKLWDSIFEMNEIAAKGSGIYNNDENVFTAAYCDVFDTALTALSLQNKSNLGDVQLFAAKNPEPQALTGIGKSDIPHCIETISKVTSVNLLNTVETKNMKNFVATISGVGNRVKILGLGACNVVYEVKLGSQNMCLKSIQSDEEESKAFQIATLSEFYEPETQKNPNLVGRTTYAGKIGQLFARYRKSRMAPTHSVENDSYLTSSGEKKEYILMSKIEGSGVATIANDGLFHTLPLSGATIESAIDCQFLAMIIGHLDLHFENCMISPKDGLFHIIDMGLSFPPFAATGTTDDVMKQAMAEFRHNVGDVMFKGTNEQCQENRKKVLNCLEQAGKTKILDQGTIDKLMNVKKIFIELSCLNTNNSLQHLIWEMTYGNAVNVVCADIFNFVSPTFLWYDHLPPLTVEMKESYLKILDELNSSYIQDMKANNFTKKEIKAMAARIQYLRGSIQQVPTLDTYIKQRYGNHLSCENYDVYARCSGSRIDLEDSCTLLGKMLQHMTPMSLQAAANKQREENAKK